MLSVMSSLFGPSLWPRASRWKPTC